MKSTSNNTTHQRIVRAAREEFLAKGFRGASLRVIAAESAVAVSNIYNHFDHKDCLFREVLSPLLNAFNKMLEEHNSDEDMELYMSAPDRYREKMVQEFMSLTRTYRAELKLLLLLSGGSSLESFREEVVRRQTEVGKVYLERFRKKYPQFKAEVSPLFVKLSSTWWMIIFTEIIANEELTEQEIERALSEYIAFGTAGWTELMRG